MQDKELYQHILSLTSPWTVSEVKLDMVAQEIQVRAEHPTGTKLCCPECQKELSCYDHGVKSVSVPWALPHSRFTIMFERFAIEDMLMTQTVKGAMTILRLQWDATWHIIERAVARGKARKEPSLLPRIGIDEKAFAKGRKFVSILFELDNSIVLAVEEDHDAEAAKSCFSQLNQEQLHSVEAIAMDMSPAFVRAAKEMIPLAENKIVHDKFHIMKMANEAVDKVRRTEHRRLLKEGDDRLKGSKYLCFAYFEVAIKNMC